MDQAVGPSVDPIRPDFRAIPVLTALVALTAAALAAGWWAADHR